MKPVIAIVIAMILGAALYGVLQQETNQNPPPELRDATLLPELRPLASFSLVDDRGETYDNQRLLGHWTLLSFGYTHCPDICPTTLAMLAQVNQQLKERGIQVPFKTRFVSIDPERDTPQRLQEYVSYFDPDFMGVTGSPEALSALTRPLGILYRKVITEESAMGYVMDHSASLILLDPQGRYFALFSSPHDAAALTEDILTITQHADGAGGGS